MYLLITDEVQEIKEEMEREKKAKIKTRKGRIKYKLWRTKSQTIKKGNGQRRIYHNEVKIG